MLRGCVGAELRDDMAAAGVVDRKCAAVIANMGGSIAGFTGNEVLALFGYPKAHEDDAERAVHAGLLVLHPEALVPALAGDTAVASGTPLTSREREILELMADGANNRVIASRLAISRHTVKFHVASILAKLGAASRTEAVALALRSGLLAV